MQPTTSHRPGHLTPEEGKLRREIVRIGRQIFTAMVEGAPAKLSIENDLTPAALELLVAHGKLNETEPGEFDVLCFVPTEKWIVRDIMFTERKRRLGLWAPYCASPSKKRLATLSIDPTKLKELKV